MDLYGDIPDVGTPSAAVALQVTALEKEKKEAEDKAAAEEKKQQKNFVPMSLKRKRPLLQKPMKTNVFRPTPRSVSSNNSSTTNTTPSKPKTTIAKVATLDGGNSTVTTTTVSSASKKVPVKFSLTPKSTQSTENTVNVKPKQQFTLRSDHVLEDEYDPMYPNNYDEFMEKRRRQRSQKRNASRPIEMDLDRSRYTNNDDNRPIGSSSSTSANQTKTLSREEKLALLQGGGDAAFARRQAFSSQPPPRMAPITKSNVLLLTNVCAKGEVDGTLQMEITQECSNFGNVVRCLVHEMKDNSVPDNEAVRIFVKFRNVGQAEKAQKELNKRFFGGREINCSFYDEEKFNKRELE